jgi:hypothetical protein
VEVGGTSVKSPGPITWFWRGGGQDPREITWLDHLVRGSGGSGRSRREVRVGAMAGAGRLTGTLHIQQVLLRIMDLCPQNLAVRAHAKSRQGSRARPNNVRDRYLSSLDASQTSPAFWPWQRLTFDACAPYPTISAKAARPSDTLAA